MRFPVVAVFGFLVLTACGEGSTEPGESGSVATTAEAATTTEATTTTSEATRTTTEATTTTSAVSGEQLAAAAAVGDMAAGEELFDRPVDGVPDNASCSTCHYKDSPWAPSLAGISAVAADRVDGMSDVDYLRQSIVDPFAFRVAGEWPFPMPIRYSDALSENEIDNLIAFLLAH